MLKTDSLPLHGGAPAGEGGSPATAHFCEPESPQQLVAGERWTCAVCDNVWVLCWWPAGGGWTWVFDRPTAELGS